MLGEFEYLILTVAATLDEDAYGAAIRAQIEQKTGRRSSFRHSPCFFVCQ